MPFERGSVPSSLADRLGAVPNGAALAAVLLAAVVGLHGAAHVTLAPASHLQASPRALSFLLWGITTLLAVGGLAALGGAYAWTPGRQTGGPRIDLEILPADERAVLEPVIDVPGITQVELVARSDYSDAKVSQTLKALRERGLLYREPQGRTYRLYPGTLLEERRDEC